MHQQNKLQKIGVVTGSRADFGLLANICNLLEKEDSVDFILLVTGSHLSRRHGNTITEIYTKNFSSVTSIDLEIHGDSTHDTNRYIAQAIEKFSEYFSENKLDKLVVLGDRYEILGVSIAASITGVRLAHIHGGEVTEGAFDEFIRHSITKMSSLHFTSHPEYKKRVIQLGEDPKTVFYVGGLGAENIELLKPSLLSNRDCEQSLGVRFKDNNIFVTYHPETNYIEHTLKDLESLLDALSELRETGIIFSLPNADTNFDSFISRINEFVAEDESSRWAFASLGQRNYFSLLQYVDAVVGNSSSGILEAPSFNIASINIGSRQKGRVKANSVIDIEADKVEIHKAIARAYSTEFIKQLKQIKNPYFKEGTARRIVDVLVTDRSANESKTFFDIKF